MDKFQETVNRGLERAHESSVAICCLARNNEARLPKTIARIELLCSHFDYARVFVYENDSTDDTKGLLYDWAKSVQNVTVQVSSPGLEAFKSVATLKRASHMCDCRNKYLDMVRESGKHFDYLMPIDVDLKHWPIDGILHSLGQECEWNCISANGQAEHRGKTIYYDTWSLVNPKGMVPRNTIRRAWPKEHPMLAVRSGFGGMAIYKADEALACYYLPKHYKGMYGSEHVGLHAVMTNKGYNRHYINPGMEVIR